MGTVNSFPLVSGAQITANDASARMEPGTIMACRTSDNWSIVEYVLCDNNGISIGEVAVQNLATIPAKQYSIAKAATSDSKSVIKGIAAATIGSNKYGFIYIGGYVPVMDVSKTVTTATYLSVSGSTAGKLTPLVASGFNAATLGDASMVAIVARSQTSFATGTGSGHLIGVWG